MLRSIAFTALAAASLATSAQAATVTVSAVLSPASFTECCFTGEVQPDNFTLDIGDTLDQTVTFTGGASVSVDEETAIWFLTFSQGGQYQSLDASGTVEFLDPSANLVSGPIALSEVMSFVHVGFYLFPSVYRTGTGPISFSGIRQVITINSAIAIDPDTFEPNGEDPLPRDYNSVTLNYFGGITPPVIPEPGTWALLIAGFGLVGTALRRRTAITA